MPGSCTRVPSTRLADLDPATCFRPATAARCGDLQTVAAVSLRPTPDLEDVSSTILRQDPTDSCSAIAPHLTWDSNYFVDLQIIRTASLPWNSKLVIYTQLTKSVKILYHAKELQLKFLERRKFLSGHSFDLFWPHFISGFLVCCYLFKASSTIREQTSIGHSK